MMLEAGARLAPVAHLDNARLQICDADPHQHPTTPRTDLSALTPEHYDLIVQEAGAFPVVGRPLYFSRVRSGGIVRLYPFCDRPYWLEPSYRKPIKYDAKDGNADGSFTR